MEGVSERVAKGNGIDRRDSPAVNAHVTKHGRAEDRGAVPVIKRVALANKQGHGDNKGGLSQFGF